MNYPAFYCTALALCRLAHLIRSCRPFKSPNSLCPAKFKITCCLVFKNTCYFQCRRCKRPKWATVWLQTAKNRRKYCHLMRFHEFFQTTFGRTISFPFPVISHAFIFKICQTIASTSIINKISRFFPQYYFLAGFCHWAQMWATSCWEGKRRQ